MISAGRPNGFAISPVVVDLTALAPAEIPLGWKLPQTGTTNPNRHLQRRVRRDSVQSL